jgi:hypothetical protein
MRFVGGDDGQVFAVVSKDDSLRYLLSPGVHPLGTFEWGGKLPSPKCATLAKAILEIVLEDPVKAMKFHRLFMHRVIRDGTWSRGAPWTFTGEDVVEIVEAIKTTASEYAPSVDKMKREIPRTNPTGNTGEVWDNAVGMSPDEVKRSEKDWG